MPNISSRYINLRDPCLYIILELKLRSKYNVLFKKNYLIKKYIAYTYYNKYESNVGTTAHCIASKANEKMFSYFFNLSSKEELRNHFFEKGTEGKYLSTFPPKSRPLIAGSANQRPGFWQEMAGIYFSISNKR